MADLSLVIDLAFAEIPPSCPTFQFPSSSFIEKLGCLRLSPPLSIAIEHKPWMSRITPCRLRAETAGEPSGLACLETIGFTLADYRALLEWTIDFERGRKVHSPTGPATRVLKHLRREPSEWLYEVALHRFAYRAYGAYDKVQALAKRLGQHWICGWKSMRGAPG